jgi:hypothetical protein
MAEITRAAGHMPLHGPTGGETEVHGPEADPADQKAGKCPNVISLLMPEQRTVFPARNILSGHTRPSKVG